jgi:hypothetical protein
VEITHRLLRGARNLQKIEQKRISNSSVIKKLP